MEFTLKLFLHLIQYAGFFFGQITNASLLFLILTRAERLFGSYRNVMAVFATYSLGYTWIEVLAEPVMHIKGSMFIVMMDGPIKFDIFVGNVLAALYCGSSALCISLLTAQFYYRYVAVCKPEHLEKMKGWKLSLLFIPCFLCFAVWFSLVHFGMHNTPEKQNFMRDVMMENYGVDITNESFIGPMYYSYDKNGKCTWRWLDIMASVLCTCILSTGLSLIAFCIVKIYTKLKNAEMIMSTKTRDLNRQLFVTLSFQTIVPLIMMYGPVGAFITLPYLEIEVGLLGNYVGASAGTYPAIEPLIAIFFIKDFRNTVLWTNTKMNSGLHTVQFIGFGCAQFTNLILLFLIHKKAKSLFGSYRHVMFVFTAYSLVYTWIEIFTLPIMHIRGSLFLMIVDSFLRYEQEIGYYVMSLYCASYALCIFLLATQFYYRYIVVCKPENLVKINGWKLGLIFLPGIFFFFIWFSLVFFVMKKTEENMEMAKEVIMETYQEDTSKVAYVALQFWDVDSNGVKHPRIWDWLSYIGCCSMIGICCSTIMFCAAKSYLKLKCSLNVMSTKTRELNKQLLLTLAFQTATPFFMMYITVGTILTLPIFEIEVGRKGNLVGSLAGVYPAIEPLIAMYFVKDFRKALSCQAKVEISSAIVQIKNDLQEDRRKSTQGSTVYINKSLI